MQTSKKIITVYFSKYATHIHFDHFGKFVSSNSRLINLFSLFISFDNNFDFFNETRSINGDEFLKNQKDNTIRPNIYLKDED